MCSAAERRADEASYDVTAWLKCMYMKDFIGRGFSGKVTGVTPNGVYVTLDDLFVEGFIRVSNLGWDYYFYNSDDCLLEGSASGEVIRLGTPLEVQVQASTLICGGLILSAAMCRDGKGRGAGKANRDSERIARKRIDI